MKPFAKTILAAIALLSAQSTATQARYANPPLSNDAASRPPLQKLYEAYRKYQYVKWCHDSRDGYLAAWVNDVELKRSRSHIKSIEKDAVEQQPSIDASGLYKEALASLDKSAAPTGVTRRTDDPPA